MAKNINLDLAYASFDEFIVASLSDYPLVVNFYSHVVKFAVAAVRRHARPEILDKCPICGSADISRSNNLQKNSTTPMYSLPEGGSSGSGGSFPVPPTATTADGANGGGYPTPPPTAGTGATARGLKCGDCQWYVPNSTWERDITPSGNHSAEADRLLESLARDIDDLPRPLGGGPPSEDSQLIVDPSVEPRRPTNANDPFTVMHAIDPPITYLAMLALVAVDACSALAHAHPELSPASLWGTSNLAIVDIKALLSSISPVATAASALATTLFALGFTAAPSPIVAGAVLLAVRVAVGLGTFASGPMRPTVFEWLLAVGVLGAIYGTLQSNKDNEFGCTANGCRRLIADVFDCISPVVALDGKTSSEVQGASRLASALDIVLDSFMTATALSAMGGTAKPPHSAAHVAVDSRAAVLSEGCSDQSAANGYVAHIVSIGGRHCFGMWGIAWAEAAIKRRLKQTGASSRRDSLVDADKAALRSAPSLPPIAKRPIGAREEGPASRNVETSETSTFLANVLPGVPKLVYPEYRKFCAHHLPPDVRMPEAYQVAFDAGVM